MKIIDKTEWNTLLEEELNLESSCGQQMRIAAGKTTDNGLGVHPAEPFPFPAADEKLACTPP